MAVGAKLLTVKTGDVQGWIDKDGADLKATGNVIVFVTVADRRILPHQSSLKLCVPKLLYPNCTKMLPI